MPPQSTNPQSSNQRNDWLSKADVLTESLPYMRRYSGHKILVKFGGHAMGDAEALRLFADDMVLLNQVGACPVIVHGGGPQIGAMLDKLGIKSEFFNGLRVTDADTVSVVEMVLCGAINKSLVGALVRAGGRAVGLSGKDSNLITARKLHQAPAPAPASASASARTTESVELGFVGEPEAIDTSVLDALIGGGMMPVIAPIASARDGGTYNINADTAAGAVAAALRARRLLMLTDVSGVHDKAGVHIPRLSIKEARGLIADGTISGGMIPKVETCIAAVEGGVEGAVILDGRERHAVLVELFTEHGLGTIITRDSAWGSA